MALEQHRLSSSAIEANQWLASRLGRLGYRVHIRTALGGGEGFECLRNLRHVFLFVMAGRHVEKQARRNQCMEPGHRQPEPLPADQGAQGLQQGSKAPAVAGHLVGSCSE